MELVKNEIITESGLHISMPVPGIIRVTDGNHKKGSYMVSARMRKSTPKLEGSRAVWGKVAIEPENHMSLYWTASSCAPPTQASGCSRWS